MPDDAQPDLFGRVEPSLPEGFRYQPDLVTADQEAEFARRLGELPFQPYEFHGHLANRRVIGFGLRYDDEKRQVVDAAPVPDFLLRLREAVGAATGRPPEAFAHVLINEYRPGAGIGWHLDRPHFEDVAGVSLLAACDFRFRRAAGAGWERRTLRVEPRSLYLLSGPSRTEWQHSIPPVDEHRYSITFRTLRIRR